MFFHKFHITSSKILENVCISRLRVNIFFPGSYGIFSLDRWDNSRQAIYQTLTYSYRGLIMKKLTIILICAVYWVLTGCAAVILGAGAGGGTYAYIDGELKRTYKAKYEETYRVCVSILDDLSQPITEETTDGVTTTLQTKRSDGTPMTIKVSIRERDWTEVGVRTGVVGFWKKDISKQFHKFVEERLISK